MLSRLRWKFAVILTVQRRAMLRSAQRFLATLVLGAGLSNTECPTLFDVFPALRCLLQQQQMDLLALEWVVVVKPPRVDERHVASRCG